MRPGQDKVIRILFAPTKCRMILAKLEIKAPFGNALNYSIETMDTSA